MILLAKKETGGEGKPERRRECGERQGMGWMEHDCDRIQNIHKEFPMNDSIHQESPQPEDKEMINNEGCCVREGGYMMLRDEILQRSVADDHLSVSIQ